MATPSNNGFCISCGSKVDWRSGVCPNANCDVNQVEWNRPFEPGPVRLPNREELLDDARRAGWHTIDTVPDDRPVIITRTYDGDHWLIARREAKVPPYIYGRLATHWHEDTIGQPVGACAVN